MDLRKVPHRPITKTKQLLVEGRTSELFFAAFLRHLGIDAEIHDFCSVSELRPFLRAFCARPEFKQMVQSFAVVRDAEFSVKAGQIETVCETPQQAFASVCSSLAAAGQLTPPLPAVFTQAAPKIGIFILPNCRDPGMLETLCLESVMTSRVCACIEQFFSCMEREGNARSRNLTKARTFAFLACKDIYDPLVGRASQKGIWPWENDAFLPLKNFLLEL